MNPLVAKREILLWNARGVANSVKHATLSDFIFTTSPLATAIVETHLGPDSKTRIADATIYHEFSSVHTTKSSGVTILVHRSFNARILTKLSTKIKHGKSAAILLTVEISDPSVDATGTPTTAPWIFAAGYIAPGSPVDHQAEYINAINKMATYCELHKYKLVLAGDFNSHHTGLGSSAAAARNRGNQVVAESLITDVFHCANRNINSSPTINSGSTLDLFLSNNQQFITNLEVMEQDLAKLSDHFPVRATIDIACPVLEIAVQPKWKLKTANWAEYTAATEFTSAAAQHNTEWSFDSLIVRWMANRNFSPETAQQTADLLALDLSDQIRRAAELALERLPPPPVNRRADLPTTDAIRSLIRIRRKIANKYVSTKRAGRDPSLVVSLAAEMRSLRASIADGIRTEARRRWAERCDAIQEPDGIHIGRVNYSQFDRTLGRSNVAPSGIVGADGTHPNSIVGSLNNMARFQSTTVHSTPPDERPNQHDSTKGITIDAAILRLQWDRTKQRIEFSQPEIDAVLQAVSKNTAAGDDDIHNLMLFHAGPTLRSNIRTLINFCHSTGTVPHCWKTVKAIPLFKSGSVHDPENYRMISLNPTLLKVMEAAILRYLQHPSRMPDTALADHQFGFRPRRATGDAIHFVLQRINYALNNDKLRPRHRFLPVAFIDISKAFGRVRPNLVLAAMVERGAPDITVRWLKAYLSNRSFYVSSLGKSSTPVPAANGTPQGAILSPFLFLNFINEVYDICAYHDVTAVLFADDICLLPNKDGPDAFKRLQNALDALTEWASRTHTTFNVKPSKSSAMLFSRLNDTDSVYPDLTQPAFALKLSGKPLAYDHFYKYLGLYLDRKLLWVKHREAAIVKATATSFQITRIINQTRAFSVHCIATLIRTILIPRAMYGCQFWSTNVNATTKIDTAIKRPLLRALGLPYCTHGLSVLTECNVLTSARYRSLYAINYVNRAIRAPNQNPTTKMVSRHFYSVVAPHTGITWQPVRDFVLPKSVFTANSVLHSAHTAAAKKTLQSEQLAELRSTHYGSSMRLSLQHDFTMHDQPHLKLESIEAAQRRAAFRFDTISPWRDFKKKKTDSPKCKWCGAVEARSYHLLRCPGLLHIRTAHPIISSLCRRIRHSTAHTKRNIPKRTVVQTVLAGFHPLLSTEDNATLRRVSQQFLTALHRFITPPADPSPNGG